MKLRLLNASHQCLCYFAYLAGYRLVHDAAGDPLFAEFLREYMDSEGTPTFEAGAGDRSARLQARADRAIRQPWCQGHHRAVVRRLVGPHPEMAAARHPGEPRRGWSGPALGGYRGQLGAVRRGRRRAWRKIDVQDQLADTLVPLARSQHENPTAFIENTEVFGDLASQPRFVEAYLWALDSLHRDGARATLETLLRKETP